MTTINNKENDFQGHMRRRYKYKRYIIKTMAGSKRTNGVRVKVEPMSPFSMKVK